jgi:hypothetical protein
MTAPRNSTGIEEDASSINDAIPKQIIKIGVTETYSVLEAEEVTELPMGVPVSKRGSLITQVASKIPIRTGGSRRRRIAGGS